VPVVVLHSGDHAHRVPACEAFSVIRLDDH
jgi:hypothetical protein